MSQQAQGLFYTTLKSRQLSSLQQSCSQFIPAVLRAYKVQSRRSLKKELQGQGFNSLQTTEVKDHASPLHTPNPPFHYGLLSLWLASRITSTHPSGWQFEAFSFSSLFAKVLSALIFPWQKSFPWHSEELLLQNKLPHPGKSLLYHLVSPSPPQGGEEGKYPGDKITMDRKCGTFSFL